MAASNCRSIRAGAAGHDTRSRGFKSESALPYSVGGAFGRTESSCARTNVESASNDRPATGSMPRSWA